MPEKSSRIQYSKLDETAKKEVDKRIVELKTTIPPFTLKQIISTIYKEMRVTIKQYHIYQALKKSPMVKIKPIHKLKEIETIEEEKKSFLIEELRESVSSNTRRIKFKINDISTSFYIVRLSEKKKYGYKTSEKIDENMEPCLTATYSVLDNLIFPNSQNFEGKGRHTKRELEEGLKEKIIEKSIPSGIKKGSIHIDSDGDYVHRSEIEIVDREGNPVPIIPSSLYLKESPNVIELKKVMDINQIYDHDIVLHYLLFKTEGEDDAELKRSMHELEESIPPKFFTFKFNYYATTTPMDAFLQHIEENGMEYILLSAGTKHTIEFVGLEEFPEEIFEIEEDIELDLSL
jgi:hypothetical protein